MVLKIISSLLKSFSDFLNGLLIPQGLKVRGKLDPLTSNFFGAISDHPSLPHNVLMSNFYLLMALFWRSFTTATLKSVIVYGNFLLKTENGNGLLAVCGFYTPFPGFGKIRYFFIYLLFYGHP